MWLPWGNDRRSSASRRLTRYRSSEATSLKDLYALLDSSSNNDGKNQYAESSVSHPSVLHRTFSLRSSPRDSFYFPSDEGRDKRIIVYFTSLRAVRATFEDCRTVLSILRGLRVCFDERDVSMHSRFLTELKTLIGEKKKVRLPEVFIGGRRIGGAEEVRRLHESSELRRIVDGVPPAAAGTCRTCGGVRFVVCGTCEGSHRVYSEKTGKFRTCSTCNENGLVRCGTCGVV